MTYPRISAALAICVLALSGCPSEDAEAECISFCEGRAVDQCILSLDSDGVPNDQSSAFYGPGGTVCYASIDFSSECSSQPFLDAYNEAWETAGCSLNAGDDDDSAN